MSQLGPSFAPVRPSFGLAPSDLPSTAQNPSTTESRTLSSSLAYNSLFGVERGSRSFPPNEQANNSVPPLRYASARYRGGLSEGRSEVSAPRGAFGGADTTAAFDRHSLDYFLSRL